MEPILLRVEEAAAQLGIGRTTMFRLISEGTIRSVLIGRRRLVPADELDRIAGGR